MNGSNNYVPMSLQHRYNNQNNNNYYLSCNLTSYISTIVNKHVEISFAIPVVPLEQRDEAPIGCFVLQAGKK